jgi:intracellular septation protein
LEYDALSEHPSQKPAKKPHGLLNFLLDFGPLLAFFIAYKLSSSGDSIASTTEATIISTGTFMVAITAALIVSQWKLGKISPMMWMSAILVLGFGTITIISGSFAFIQHKPTFLYLLFAAILFLGVWRGKAPLKYLLEYAFEGLSDEGWLKLSRNWGFFFIGMAVLNEGMIATLSEEMWLTLKVWGVTALTFLFGMANIPMLLRHGLKLADDEVTPDT